MISVLLATDADWLYEEIDASLADSETMVHRVRSGRDVLAAYRQTKPDLVILDLQIGNAGGVATSLAIRQEQEMGRLADARIIMLLDRSADVFLGQMAQADGWLVKPLDSLRLRRATNAVLRGDKFHEGVLDAVK